MSDRRYFAALAVVSCLLGLGAGVFLTHAFGPVPSVESCMSVFDKARAEAKKDGGSMAWGEKQKEIARKAFAPAETAAPPATPAVPASAGEAPQ